MLIVDSRAQRLKEMELKHRKLFGKESSLARLKQKKMDGENGIGSTMNEEPLFSKNRASISSFGL